MPPKRVITVETKVQDKKKQLLISDGASNECLKCGSKCAGYVPHAWKKECVNCGCTRDTHSKSSVYDAHPYIMKKISQEDHFSADEKRKLNLKYAWYPPGIDGELVEKYMDCLPKNCIPFKGSKVEQQRKHLLYYQHPPHDTNVEYCHQMPELEKKRMKKFVERCSNSFGIGKVSGLASDTKIHKCHGCSDTIPPDSVVVTAAQAERVWHPQCFRCSTCMELLNDLFYFYSMDKDEIYCGRHHAESILPRCQGCDEIIFSGTYTEAKGKRWHKYHFCCTSCQLELHGKKYKEVNEAIYCELCYENSISVKCYKCHEKIGLGSKLVKVNDDSWHMECFTCTRCRENLKGQKYYQTGAGLLCSDCCSDQAGSQCHGCKNAISSTVSFLRHKTYCWHAECFKCALCQTWLASGKFHEMGDTLMCTTCYTSKVGVKCAECQETISSKGVRIGLKSFHPECFKCKICDKILIAGKDQVKEKNGEPTCSDCYLKQVNKKCYRCKGPITSRHTLYKGHPFHIECFKCNLCGSAIDNATFFETSLNEILCVKCVQQ